MNLTVLLWLPLAFGVAGLFAPGVATRIVATTGALATLAYAIVLAFDYDGAARGLQFVIDKPWISELGIHYKIGADGLNLALVLLAAVLFAASTAWAATTDWERPRLFFFWLALAETGVLGALLAQDLALFVIFFDVMLVPFVFLAVSGPAPPGPERIAGVVKLFIYTLVGSLLMLAAAIATGVLAPGEGLTFDLAQLAQRRLPNGTQDWVFLCFAAAFLVKMPSFPFHGWMPDGYKAMPLPVLAVFSGILSKVAAYGFLRIALPLFPHAAAHYQTLMLLIALASVLYGSAMAFTTNDTRLILGYSSVAQLGFITLGVFSLTDQGAQGALLQSVNHGLVVAPAFFIVALLGRRAGSEDLRAMGGLAFRAPVLATLFLIVALANLAMPGSSNFVGEFLILLGVFQTKIVIAIIAFTGVALASVYTLRLFVRSMHNRQAAGVESREISVRDGLVLVPLVVAILALALYPQLPLARAENAVKAAVAPAKTAAQPAREASR